MIVQQARCHPEGQKDLQLFNTTCFGFGSVCGSLIGAVVLANKQPNYAFGVCAFVAVLLTLAGACTSDELETNEFAQVKDLQLEKYEKENDGKTPSICTLIGLKIKALCIGLADPLLLRFFGMLILQGIFLPSF